MRNLLRPLETSLLIFALGVMRTAAGHAQSVTFTPPEKNEPLTFSSNVQSFTATSNALAASYKLPVPLSNLGTISVDENAVCNLLFRHKDINGGAWLLASSDKTVDYYNQSSDVYTSFQWTVPGSSPSSFSTTDAKASYSAPGVYAMPTLKASNGVEASTYTAPYTIKVGGTSEITTIDCREWGTTYMLSAAQYGDGQGFVGGTNAVDIVGFGNLFMLGTDDAYLDGVNVYLLKKPTKYKEGAKITLQVWMTNITSTGVQLAYLPVEGSIVNMKDIKADGEDGAWAPIYGGAVAQFRFDEPLSMYGKTTFFVSVEGFSNDPSTEDFVMLEDMIGKELDEVQSANMLCHNSFARQKGETDYLRPVSMFGGGTGSFAICPLIRIPGAPSGINTTTAEHTRQLTARFSDNSTIEVLSPSEGNVSVVDAGGTLLANGKVADGKAYISVPNTGHGLYIISGPNGQTAKILR